MEITKNEQIQHLQNHYTKAVNERDEMLNYINAAKTIGNMDDVDKFTTKYYQMFNEVEQTKKALERYGVYNFYDFEYLQF